jgi:hypothetical protein
MGLGCMRRAPHRFLDQVARLREIAQRRPMHETDAGEQQTVVFQVGEVPASHVHDCFVRDRASDGDDDFANAFRGPAEKTFERASELPGP